jgi:hypothetical protein
MKRMGCCPDAGCRLRSQEWLPERPALLERKVRRRLALPVLPERQVRRALELLG